MVVGETVLTNTNPTIGQTAPVTSPTSLPVTSSSATSLALPDHTYVADVGNDHDVSVTNIVNGNHVGNDLPITQNVVLVPAALADVRADNGDVNYVMGDQDMDDEGPWGEGDESEGGEESDGLSLVGSIADRQSPTPNGHGHERRMGGGLVISDLSDGDITSLEEGEYDFGYTALPGDELHTQIPTTVPQQHCLVSATVTGFTTEKGQRKQLFQQLQSQQQQQQQQPTHHHHQPKKHHQSAGGGAASSGAATNGGLPDIVFIVELTWSDGRVNVVTRTYTDFCRLQYYLINEFVDVPANESPARLNIYLPVRRDVLPDDSFAQAHAEPQDSILLAESRELLLNQYVQDLIKLPPKISASPTALTFFESRNSDPVPYRETVDKSRVNLTDQYILCWI